MSLLDQKGAAVYLLCANGSTRVFVGDYIVHEADGSFSVVSEDLFKEKYSPVLTDEEAHWYEARKPERIYAIQYTGQNAKQIEAFIADMEHAEVCDDGRIELQIQHSASLSIYPGNFVALTPRNEIVVWSDKDMLDAHYRKVPEDIPVIPEEPEPEIKDPPEPSNIKSSRSSSQDILKYMGKTKMKTEYWHTAPEDGYVSMSENGGFFG